MDDGWEYRTELFDFRKILSSGNFEPEIFDKRANSLGWDGWELVSVMDTNFSQGSTFWVVASFKRKLTPQRRAEIVKKIG